MLACGFASPFECNKQGVSGAPAAIAVELVVIDAPAAHPAPPGGGRLGESGTTERCGAKQNRMRLRWRALLLCRHQLSRFNRRYGDEFFIDEIGARQRSVESGSTFAEQALNIEFLAQG